MQKPNNVNQLTMIAIPTDMLEEAGIGEYTTMEVFVDRGRIIIQQLEDEDEDDAYEDDDDCVCCPYCGCREDHRL